MKIKLSPQRYQIPAVQDVDTPFLGVSGGKRSGKSRLISCEKAIYLSALHPGKPGLIASPTYGMTRRNLLPILREVAGRMGIQVKGLDTKSPSELQIEWPGGTSTIHLDVSIENWERLNGMSLAWACVDETDKAKAEDTSAFVEELTFRCSNPYPGRSSQINLTGAPELNGFMAEFFIEKNNPEKKLFKWSMLENKAISEEYKQRILDTIPEKKQSGWVRGEFMYNNDGLVYDEFDPTLNHTDLTLADIHPIETIDVCWDINDGGTSVVIGVRRQNHMLILDEWMGMKDTAAVIDKVRDQPWALQARLSCDPASTQVFTFIHRSNLKHAIMTSAPLIEYRITSLNNRFGTQSKYSATENKRHLLINTKKCKVLTRCLMRQGYVKGIPDKKTWIEDAKTDISGPLDALGYLVFREWPYNPKNPTQKLVMRGF